MSDEENSKLFRIWKTTLEMLRDRGFLVLDSEVNMHMSEFLVKFGENFKREDLDMSKTMKDDLNDRIFVFFPNEPKLTVKIAKRYAERMRTEKVLRGIIVAKEAPTPIAKRAVEDLSQRYYLEVFMDAELLVNVNNHSLVPRHEVLTNEEKKVLLEQYTVKETQTQAMNNIIGRGRLTGGVYVLDEATHVTCPHYLRLDPEIFLLQCSLLLLFFSVCILSEVYVPSFNSPKDAVWGSNCEISRHPPRAGGEDRQRQRDRR